MVEFRPPALLADGQALGKLEAVRSARGNTGPVTVCSDKSELGLPLISSPLRVFGINFAAEGAHLKWVGKIAERRLIQPSIWRIAG